MAGPEKPRILRPEHIRAVRLGHGANCSSIGSVVDTLFVTAVAGGAVFAAICAAMSAEAAPVDAVAPADEAKNPVPDQDDA